ncbi:hypothetical protein CLH62_06775 [Marinobacter guineae]|uniref:Uncharacterized protein n=1 Tax=Marinobacter guineae TaxID=432303 RepID=A0A2G1VKG1_9GAMM|nr:DUF6448 family protein [Marinobacter guineae]PHQ27271.1 hypothetical protein CLH62_06775 [Marinobacter guineae]
MKSFRKTQRIATLALISGTLLWSSASFAHCDSMDGPVIGDARTALNEQSLKPVLKWIGPADEKDLAAAFNDTLEVRKGNPRARELADKYFFETLVRLHRATEGAPYTGLKPAGSASDAAKAADKALAEGNVDVLARKLGEKVTGFVTKQFQETMQGVNAESVSDGRQFVDNYVRYVHSIEEIHNIVAGAHDEH